jgi:hypothetical protein
VNMRGPVIGGVDHDAQSIEAEDSGHRGL